MKITISEYNKDWPQAFIEEKEDILSLLKDDKPIVEHVGSTSVPGLAAKPIIDIMVGVKNEQDLNVVPNEMVKLSYVYLPIYNKELPFRRFFIGVKDQYSTQYPSVLTNENFIDIPHHHRKSHIHIVPIDCQWWHDHLLFRDYLRKSSEDLQIYEKMKTELAKREWVDGNEYAAAKTNVIQRILMKAKNCKNH